MKQFQWLVWLLLSISAVAYADIEVGNGVWLYDAIFDDDGNRIGMDPGLFSRNINTYNQNTARPHRINQLYSYGGFLKMFCEGSGGTSASTPCTKDTMRATYFSEVTSAYWLALNQPLKTVSIMPIIDGLVGGTFLKNFNNMSQKTAFLLADAVAEKYCADPKIDGVQFDLEPFDMTQPGQRLFYTQIAKNFAGRHFANLPDPYHCVDTMHPNGRVFSVFASARKVNLTVSNVLNKFRNGYFIDTLYTLIAVTEESNPPDVYQILAKNEVKRMVKQALLYPVKFQFAIPASATMGQFEVRNGVSSGYSQLTYVQLAIAAIDQYARNDPNYLGTSLWAYSSRRIRRGVEYFPAIPPANVLYFASQNL